MPDPKWLALPAVSKQVPRLHQCYSRILKVFQGKPVEWRLRECSPCIVTICFTSEARKMERNTSTYFNYIKHMNYIELYNNIQQYVHEYAWTIRELHELHEHHPHKPKKLGRSWKLWGVVVSPLQMKASARFSWSRKPSMWWWVWFFEDLFWCFMPMVFRSFSFLSFVSLCHLYLVLRKNFSDGTELNGSRVTLCDHAQVRPGTRASVFCIEIETTQEKENMWKNIEKATAPTQCKCAIGLCVRKKQPIQQNLEQEIHWLHWLHVCVCGSVVFGMRFASV